MQVPINAMLNLFDSLVLPTLNYGCEVLKFSTAENVERVHRKFFKWHINVKCQQIIYHKLQNLDVSINYRSSSKNY